MPKLKHVTHFFGEPAGSSAGRCWPLGCRTGLQLHLSCKIPVTIPLHCPDTPRHSSSLHKNGLACAPPSPEQLESAAARGDLPPLQRWTIPITAPAAASPRHSLVGQKQPRISAHPIGPWLLARRQQLTERRVSPWLSPQPEPCPAHFLTLPPAALALAASGGREGSELVLLTLLLAFSRAPGGIQQIGSVPSLPRPRLGKQPAPVSFSGHPSPGSVSPALLRASPPSSSHKPQVTQSCDGNDSRRSLSIAAAPEGSGHPPLQT